MAAFTTFALTLTLVVPNSIRRNLPEELWKRTRTDPKSNQDLRDRLGNRFVILTHQSLLEEELPITSGTHAFLLLAAVQTELHRSPPRTLHGNSIAQIERFLHESPDAEIKFALAGLHHESGDYKRCITLIEAVTMPYQVIRARYLTGPMSFCLTTTANWSFMPPALTALQNEPGTRADCLRRCGRVS